MSFLRHHFAQFYRDLFQDPAVETTIRDTFIPGSVVMDNPAPQTVVAKSSEITPDGNQSVNSAFPMVQPMKA